MKVLIPTLSYELNTMVRKHRNAIGYSQEEFAFLIGRPLSEVQANEDLTSNWSYDINHTNFYARVLGKKPKGMFFSESFDEPSINITATKSITKKTGVNYRGTGTFNGKQIDIESYSILIESSYDTTDEDQEIVSVLLDRWLRDGYFVNGITGYALYQDLLGKQAAGEIELPDSFRPILVAHAVIGMCSRRKKPKLLPQRDLPKTPEKWLLYKEDV